MTSAPPSCPTCSADLRHVGTGDFDTWMCPNSHGLAVRPVADRDLVGADALAAIWDRARLTDPAAHALRSPRTGAPMVSVRVGFVDGPEVCVGGPGTVLREGGVWLDVDVWNRLIWIGEHEVVSPPAADHAAIGPSSETLAALRLALSGSQEVAGRSTEPDRKTAETWYRRVAACHEVAGLFVSQVATAQADAEPPTRRRSQPSPRSRAAASRVR